MSSQVNTPVRSSGGNFDTLSSPALLTPTHTVHAMQPNNVSETSFSTPQKEDKLPHDASVFVGSLPSNIDQGDLSRMLTEHLSEHTQIKNIKVVRDAKGGVCAFVQCENAISATALIQTLHSRPPKPFLGRILRYEPARAFRTLLVSYRTPTQFIRSNDINGPSSPTFSGSEVDLELPDAMRIWKHKNSRFHSILYNADAIQAEENRDRNGTDSCALDSVIFFQPLKFDEETLHKIASYFGRLEKFTPFETLKADEVQLERSPGATRPFSAGHADGEFMNAALEYASYPAPHNAPRSPTMNTTCWEIKWEHRDDCVSALMTLKRVPHLTVTWAHQPVSPSGHPANLNYQQVPTSPSYSLHTHRRISPAHVFFSPGGSTRLRPQVLQEAIQSRSVLTVNDHGDLDINCSSQRKLLEPSHDISERICAWADGSEASRLENASKESVVCSHRKSPATPGRRSWADGGYSTAASSTTDEDAGKIKQDFGNLSEQQVKDDSNDSNGDGAQDLYMPQTPSLDDTSITPVTPGSHFPITPTSSGIDVPQCLGSKDFETKEDASFNSPQHERVIDPTTLFVGGLEMFGPGAWDEEKVKNFFSRFGGLESVKVVRPINSCAAFAFVKFDNPEAPARAVLEEHNHVYEGRAMRVQLRDCNPPKNNWKYGRGRGRAHQNHFNTQRRFHYRQPYEVQNQTSYPFENEGLKSNFKERDDTSEIQLTSLAAALPSASKLPLDGNHSGSDTIDHSSSMSDLPTTARTSPPMEKYREWYDEPESPAHTPEPSSLGSSVSAAGAQFPAPTYAYPLPHTPFFPSQPWMQPYMAQAPYHLPYYPGYPVYPPAASHLPPQAHTSPPNSDVGGPTIGTQPTWPHVGMYASYIPYPTVLPRPAVVESGQASQLAAQAPLMPTGFIQNEQGTLIAVYQPEALDQYMAGSGSTPPSMSHPNHLSMSPGPHRWGNASPYPHEVNNAQLINAAHSTPNQGRVKSAAFSPVASQQFSEFQQSSSPLRGGVNVSFNNSSPLYRRQGQRRENPQQSYASSVRHHNHPRPYTGRSSRGHMHISAHVSTPDLGHPASQPAIAGNEWNRWNGSR